MEAITDLDDGNTILIGGADANPANYPANFYTNQGGSRCSGTIIGERVLSSAAHCVDNGGKATLKFRGVSFTGTCTHHPDYKNNKTADWALCVLDQTIAGFKFEKILTDLSVIKVGSTVELTGYGCTQEGGSGGNDGKFRIGRIKVKRLPSGNNNDTVTEGDVALCYGDSGGSAYYYANNDRYMFANNSRGDIKRVSYLSSFTGSFKSWASVWAAQKDVKICGLHADAEGCRLTSSPLPSSLPESSKSPTPPAPSARPPLPSSVPPIPEGLSCKQAFSQIWSCLFG